MHSHDILLAVRRVLLVAALSATGATRASAQTITFDALTGLNGQGFVSYSESGYDVDLFSGAICMAMAYGNPMPDLFGGFICNRNTTSSTLRIRRSGGGLFSFLGTDLATQNGSATYTFSGFVASSAAYSSSSTFDTTGPFAFFAGPNPTTSIDELQIGFTVQSATSYNIDNIRLAVTTTPEPASLVLFGSGLAALAAVRRKRASSL